MVGGKKLCEVAVAGNAMFRREPAALVTRVDDGRHICLRVAPDGLCVTPSYQPRADNRDTCRSAHGFERPMPGQSLQMVCVWAVLVTFGSVPVWYEVVLPQASSVESTIDILADEINNI
jgi:hypothetical protein